MDTSALDWIVVRENSEGEYAGLGGRNLSGRGPGNEVAVQTALFTETGCERIIRFAFELALTRQVPKVSSVTKSNAQQYGMVLVGRSVPPGRRGLPGRRNRECARRCHERPVCAGSAEPVRGGRLEPVRGYPLRPGLSTGRQSRPGRQCQPEPGAPVSVHVRTGPRIRPGHRRTRHQQSGGGDRQRRPDAGPPGASRGGPQAGGSDRGRGGVGHQDTRRRRQRRNGGSHRGRRSLRLRREWSQRMLSYASSACRRDSFRSTSGSG